MVKSIQKLGTLEIGDIVTLESGSPKLTVVGFVAPEPTPDFTPHGAHVVNDMPLVAVAWFENGVFGQAKLPLDAFIVPPPPAPTPVPAPPPPAPAARPNPPPPNPLA
jgi:hypothetical protein